MFNKGDLVTVNGYWMNSGTENTVYIVTSQKKWRLGYGIEIGIFNPLGNPKGIPFGNGDIVSVPERNLRKLQK